MPHGSVQPFSVVSVASEGLALQKTMPPTDKPKGSPAGEGATGKVVMSAGGTPDTVCIRILANTLAALAMSTLVIAGF